MCVAQPPYEGIQSLYDLLDRFAALTDKRTADELLGIADMIGNHLARWQAGKFMLKNGDDERWGEIFARIKAMRRRILGLFTGDAIWREAMFFEAIFLEELVHEYGDRWHETLRNDSESDPSRARSRDEEEVACLFVTARERIEFLVRESLGRDKKLFKHLRAELFNPFQNTFGQTVAA
jgi:hypothetical protein